MHAEAPSSSTAGGGVVWSNLPWELLADIGGRLPFTDRVAFTAVFPPLLKPEAPCLVLPNDPECVYKTTYFSLTDHRTDMVRRGPLRDYAVLGSSGGWLAVADNQRRMLLVNPATWEQHALPEIATFVGRNVFSDDMWFRFEKKAIRPYPDLWRPYPRKLYRLSTRTNRVGRQVVLSASARPGSYAAMLILAWESHSAPAFATAEDSVWRLAPPRHDDVVDAVHHGGRFYSLSCSGIVEAWDHKEQTSEVVCSRVAGQSNFQTLAATPDGRLIVVLWDAVSYRYDLNVWSKASFKVQILDEASGRWQETDDIGQCAVLVGAENNTVCVSTREHQELSGNCVYFTDEVRREVGVYSLQHRTVRTIQNLNGDEDCTGLRNAAAWFTPYIVP